jgi:hypothetical protein
LDAIKLFGEKMSESDLREKRKADDRTIAREKLMLLNWPSLKASIKEALSGPGRTENGMDNTHEKILANSITLSCGFQMIRNMPSPNLKSALYIPHKGTVLLLDKDHIQTWKSGIKTQRIPVTANDYTDTGIISKKQKDTPPSLVGLSTWMYLEKYNIFVINTRRLQVNIVDMHFQLLSSHRSPKPSLWCIRVNIVWNIVSS